MKNDALTEDPSVSSAPSPSIVYADVVVTTVGKPLLYQWDQELQIGQIVSVPVRGHVQIGVVVAIKKSLEESLSKEANLPQKKMKKMNICSVAYVFSFVIAERFLNFLQWMETYTLIPCNKVQKMALPFSVNEFLKMETKKAELDYEQEKIERVGCANVFFSRAVMPELNEEQKIAVDALTSHYQFHAFVLDGVTGSGKTETYVAALLMLLRKKSQQQILILLPEIALTSSLIQRFEKYFGLVPYVWCSRTTKTKKRQIWEQAVSGKPMVVIGTRSALFIPFADLCAVVVDEEHDASYKQNEQGFYHARDMALVRAKAEDFPVILASATPSIETLYNVLIGKYQHVQLRQRFSNIMLPKMVLVDMRQEDGHPALSGILKEAIKKALVHHEQSLLFLNQRGYAPVAMCCHCGYRWRCPQCEVNLTFYKGRSILCCHHCGYQMDWDGSCPQCHEQGSVLWGIGLEKMVELVQKEFPTARVLSLSSEVSKMQRDQAFEAIKNNEIDIIIGTQILAKGHHFPYLTTVGIIDADQSVNSYDLRANEKTFQLLMQVAGRAGRENNKGCVFLQTYSPESPLLQALVAYDRDLFYERELEDRKNYTMPPFCRLVAIIVSSYRQNRALEEATYLAQTFPTFDPKEVLLLGPVPAPFARLRNRYRYRLLIKADKNIRIQEVLKKWAVSRKSDVSVQIDIDPYDFT